MLKRFLRFNLLLAALSVLIACAETPQVTRSPAKLRLAEAADQAAVLKQLVGEYAVNHAWVSTSTASLTQQEALSQVHNGLLDAALLHQEPGKTAGVWVSGLAHDPIAVIVHPSNPLSNVTLSQLSDLFQGRTFDWTSLGGTGEVIPVSREAEANSRQVFEERVMQTRAVTRNAILKASAQAMLDFVARTPGAIGYVPLSYLNERVKAVAIEGVSPTAETAANGKYVIASPLYVIAKSEPQGDLREFMAWLLGNPGQTLLSQLGLGRVR